MEFIIASLSWGGSPVRKAGIEVMRRLVTTRIYRTEEDLGIPKHADIIGTEVTGDLETSNVWIYQIS